MTPSERLANRDAVLSRSALSLGFLSAGSFDFVPLLQGGFTKTPLSGKTSAHYPLWVEFSLRSPVRDS